MKYEILEKKKKQLDTLRQLGSELAKNLEEWFISGIARSCRHYFKLSTLFPRSI